MKKAGVYFTDMHAGMGSNLQDKLVKLMKRAGFETIDFNRKYAAVKLHFGEPGNLAYLRPNYAKTVADMVKSLGGKPFLTDCNTLYPGSRKNALDHIDAAYLNGYNPFTTGCHVLIGDGLKGTDEALVPINCEYVKEAKIGRAIMDADVFISLTHFKGHDMAGFGGAFKNIGMGCGSRAGKMEMHSNEKPEVNASACVGCGACVKNCAHDAVAVVDKTAVIDYEKCVGCGRCICVCPMDAMRASMDETSAILNKKMAEYAYAVLKDRPSFHISLVVDVSPSCDCLPCNDIPIVPDVGMFASFDPVALDKACADAVNSQVPVPGSKLGEVKRAHADHFTAMHPDTDWRACLEHAQELGLGTMEYELVRV